MMIILLGNMAITEIGLILTLLGSFIGFLIYFKSEKKKRDAEAQGVHLSVGQVETDREIWFREQASKWIRDLEDIHKKHSAEIKNRDQEIANLVRENLKLLREHEQDFDDHVLDQTARKRLMSKIDVAYWETNGEGFLTYCNGHFLNLYGMTADEAIGEGWTKAIRKEERGSVFLEWRAALADLNDDVEIYCDLINQVTEVITPVRVMFSIASDKKGKIIKVFGVTLPL